MKSIPELDTIEIQVTQDHIDRGRARCTDCPIALAVAERSNSQVSVSDKIRFYDRRKGGGFSVKLEPNAETFITDFDYDGGFKFPVKPFTLIIDTTTRQILT